MHRLGLISRVEKVLKRNGEFIRNPLVIIDRYIDDGVIVYGEMKSGKEMADAKTILKESVTDFTQLDASVNEIVWRFTNLFPGCLIKSIDGIRAKKKFFWDQTKLANRHWLAANMQGEALLGFNAFNTKKITGKDVIDFVKYRQLIAEGNPMDEELFEAVLGKP